MIGIPLGLLYANAAEWAIHKYILHGVGKDRKRFFSFHWHEHHRNSRQDEGFDVDYTKPLLRWTAPGKELAALTALGIVHLPLFAVAPFFASAAVYGAVNYYRVHKKAHLDPEWARKHVPWHVDHHMGPNQDANWCVTKPWFDIILGTRERYVGTVRELEDGQRKSLRKAKRTQRARSISAGQVLQPA